MRWIIFLGLVWVGIFLGGCQQAPTAPTTPETTPLPARAGDEERPNFIDTEALQNGRSLLIAHLTEKENLDVPAADTWQPDGTYTDGDWQVYRFTRDAWQLTMSSRQGEENPFMYRILVSGPGNFRYAADIYADGTVTPNQ